MKKNYISPVLMLTGGHDISYGDSQGTHSGDSPYTWQGISQEDQDLFWANFDDTDLADVDEDGDYIITQTELDAFFAQYL